MWAAIMDWKESILGGFLLLCTAALGVLMRYAHEANQQKTKLDWRRLPYEIPTVIGMTVLAVPVSDYLATHYGVSHGVVAAVCLCGGYLGTRLLDIVADFVERFVTAKDKADDKSK